MILLLCWQVAFAKDNAKMFESKALGPFDLIPLIEVDQSYNDNIFFNNRNRQASLLTQVRSGLQLSLDRKPNRFSLSYGFQSWSFASSPQDDYVDQFFGGQEHIEFNARNRFDLEAKYIDSHNQRGTFFTQPGLPGQQTPTPDQFHQYLAQAKYRYGTESSKGNLELIADVDDFNYDTRRSSTSTFDKTKIGVTPGFYYRFMPKSQLLMQVESQWYEYKQQTSATVNNFSKYRYLTGVTWNESSKTTGSIRVGYLQQFYENGSSGVQDFTWDINLLWVPLTYSRFNLTLSKDVMPTSGYGTASVNQQYRLGWIHEWNERLITDLSASYNNIDNKNVVGLPVTNDINMLQLDVNYAIKQWLGLGVNYSLTSQHSTKSELNFDQNIVMFYITANPKAKREFSAPWQYK